MSDAPKTPEQQAKSMTMELLRKLHPDKLGSFFDRIREPEKRAELEKAVKELMQVVTEIHDEISVIKGIPKSFSKTWNGKVISLVHNKIKEGVSVGMRAQGGYKLTTPEVFLKDAKYFYDTGVFPGHTVHTTSNAGSQRGPFGTKQRASPDEWSTSSSEQRKAEEERRQHAAREAATRAAEARATQERAEAARKAAAAQEAARKHAEAERVRAAAQRAAEQKKRDADAAARAQADAERKRENAERRAAELQKQKDEEDKLQEEIGVLSEDLRGMLRKTDIGKYLPTEDEKFFEFPVWSIPRFSLQEQVSILRSVVPVLREFGARAVTIHTLTFLATRFGHLPEWGGHRVYIPSTFFTSADPEKVLRAAVERYLQAQTEKIIVTNTAGARRIFSNIDADICAQLRLSNLPYIELENIPTYADIALAVYVINHIPGWVGASLTQGSRLQVVGGSQEDDVTYAALGGDSAKTLRISLTNATLNAFQCDWGDKSTYAEMEKISKLLQEKVRKAVRA